MEGDKVIRPSKLQLDPAEGNFLSNLPLEYKTAPFELEIRISKRESPGSLWQLEEAKIKKQISPSC